MLAAVYEIGRAKNTRGFSSDLLGLFIPSRRCSPLMILGVISTFFVVYIYNLPQVPSTFHTQCEIKSPSMIRITLINNQYQQKQCSLCSQSSQQNAKYPSGTSAPTVPTEYRPPPAANSPLLRVATATEHKPAKPLGAGPHGGTHFPSQRSIT